MVLVYMFIRTMIYASYLRTLHGLIFIYKEDRMLQKGLELHCSWQATPNNYTVTLKVHIHAYILATFLPIPLYNVPLA